jgi:hypothetical protein
MSPPDAKRSPGTGGAPLTKSPRKDRPRHHVTSGLAIAERPWKGEVQKYLAGRQRVLGGRFHLPDDPELAAAWLVDLLGEREARRWIGVAYGALPRRRAS